MVGNSQSQPGAWPGCGISETGNSISWQLPEGLVDTLAFDPTDKHLLLFRMETADWTHPPDNRSPVQQFPRVVASAICWPVRIATCGMRRRTTQPGKPTFSIDGSFLSGQPPTGAVLCGNGRSRAHARQEGRLIKVFESATGKEVLSLPGEGFHLDATGSLMQFAPENRPGNLPYSLIEIPSGKWVGSIDPPAESLGPGARLSCVATANHFGHSLHRVGNQIPLVTLGIDFLSTEGYWTFSNDGVRFAWGNRDGTVTICYLPEIQSA